MSEKEETFENGGDGRKSETDDFWNLENLLPQKARRTAFATRAVDTSAVDVRLETPRQTQNAVPSLRIGEKNAIPASAPKPADKTAEKDDSATEKAETVCIVPIGKETNREPERVIKPADSLIDTVRIYPWRCHYPYYERFCELAKMLLHKKADPCEPVSFFSYMPQYDQMGKSQLSWYLYWRSMARAGTFLNTDYSYIFLFLFEIINLPEDIEPVYGQEMMCRIWKRYSATYPLLNRYLSEWICDYSLIHDLRPPVEVLGPACLQLAQESSLREFYLYPILTRKTNSAENTDMFLRFCTNYDYKTSKVYQSHPESRPLFEAHVPAVVTLVLDSIWGSEGKLSTDKLKLTTIGRDSFIGALCTPSAKKRIEVDYYSFSRSHELRFLITDTVKYAENRIRSFVGVKSKLSVYALPPAIGAIIDGYFEEKQIKRTRSQETETPAYEKLYDLPDDASGEANAVSAAEIERNSWDTTRKLVEAFEDETAQNSCIIQPVVVFEKEILSTDAPNNGIETNPSAEKTGQPDSYMEILALLLRGEDAAAKALVRQKGWSIEHVAEEINNRGLNRIGDVVLEDDGKGFYRVYADYEEDVRNWLNEYRGADG